MRRVTGLIPTRQAAYAGSARDVFRTFLRLGLTSFGGPVAHVGYMRDACVVRRGWVDEARFAQLVALCQFLPGPASSQLGFALGLLRAGWRGGVAAFVAFTCLLRWPWSRSPCCCPGFRPAPGCRRPWRA